MEVHHGLLEECANYIRNNEVPQGPDGVMSTIKSLQRKCRVTKADKGPIAVRMDRAIYNEKISAIWTSSRRVMCSQFDLKVLNKNVREAINGGKVGHC